MKFKTSITDIKDGKESVRGHGLLGLVSDHGFVNTIFLLLHGRLPEEKEYKMLDAIFTAIIDHGPGTTSALAARISASAKNPLHASVAAGMLGMGDRHGTVIEQAMGFFYKHKDVDDVEGLLQEMKERKEYVMGYGHKIFRDEDPRAGKLFAIAEELGIAGEHSAFAKKVEKVLNETSSRNLPINCDGAIAGILCDIGFDAAVGNGIFVIGRVPGLVAHIVEERASGEGIRRVSQDNIEYTE